MSDTRTVIDRHLASFAAGRLEDLMSDYTERSVLSTPDGRLAGPAAIRQFMARLFVEFAQPGARFDLGVQHVDGEFAHIVWAATTPDNHYEFATDTFVVRDGKIVYQTFAGVVVPRRPSESGLLRHGVG